MQVQLKPLENGQGIRFPKELLKAAGFLPDDILRAEVRDGQIILSRAFHHRTLPERAAQYDGRLNLSAEMERDEPVGSEVW